MIYTHKQICLKIETEGENITHIGFIPVQTASPASNEVEKQVKLQLDEYFSGTRKRFQAALQLAGTPFQVKVWQALLEIPYGKTESYGELAVRIGHPKALRAVGGALNRNPIAIIVPCHRVIGADGKLTGFAGGLDTKKYLLELEQA